MKKSASSKPVKGAKGAYTSIPGINIQVPWSGLLLSGEKKIETRGYALPIKFMDVPLALIETSGTTKPRFKARIVGVITFSHSFEYKSASDWKSDFGKHLVQTDNPSFSFDQSRKKFGWVVKNITSLAAPVPAPTKKGIIFASQCRVPAKYT